MPCQISRYHCPEDESTVEQLSELAELQQVRETGFQNVYPWKDKCANEYHYVAKDESGIICGWLTAKIRKWKTQKYMYLSEISTRRIRNDLFGGVGQRLHMAMLVDANQLGMNFVYLYPLNDSVRSLYMKPEWGYESFGENIKYLFHVLKKKPSNELLETMKSIDAAGLLQQVKTIAKEESKDRRLLGLIELARPKFLEDKEATKKLEEELEIMEGNELPIEEQKELLRQFFEEFLTPT